MYDLIASWMTSGGPLQELGRDDHHSRNQESAEAPPAQERQARRLVLPFTRRLRPAEPCSAACAAR